MERIDEVVLNKDESADSEGMVEGLGVVAIRVANYVIRRFHLK